MHAIVELIFFLLATTHPKLVCPASRLIQAASTNSSPPTLDKSLPLLEYVPSPFQSHELFPYEVTVPAKGTFGVYFQDDEFFGLPIIVSMDADSPFLRGCKKTLRRQSWIINIHHEEPITVTRVLEYLDFLRKSNILTFNVTLAKRVNTQKTNYEELRTRFDNIRPIVGKATIPFLTNDTSTVSTFHLSPAAKFAVYSTTKPKAPNDWKELSEDNLREFWIKGMYERYLHNYNAGL